MKRILQYLRLAFKAHFIEHPARIAAWAIMIVIIWTNLDLKFWNNPKRILISDVRVYYVYLPAVFIYHDLTLQFVKDEQADIGDVMYLVKSQKGLYYIQTTYGLALLYSPFFLGAHAYAILSHDDATGYSPPYKFTLMLSYIFYLAVGIYFLKKFLLKYFSQWVTAITLVVIFLGTNLFYYSTYEGPMAHAYNFAVIAAFICYTAIWYERVTLRNTIIIGALIGLIALIRPVNLLVVLFFVLWRVYSWKSLHERIIFLFRSYKWLLLMALIFFIIWIPQLLYWKFISGSYLFYSYTDQRFYFNNPQIFSSLFSYRKGLFLYFPLMAVAYLGIPFLYRKFRGFILPVALFAAINVYVLSSWCFWWFGGGFGPRSYIDTYAILAIPFAALISKALHSRWYLKILCIFVIAVLVWFNLFQTKQYYHGAISWAGMTKEAYWDSFLHRYPSKEYWKMLRFPARNKAVKGIYYQGDLTIEELYPKKKENPPIINEKVIDEREKYIKSLDKYIRTQDKWFREINKKAAKRGISVDSMIRIDANWLYKKKLEKAGITPLKNEKDSLE